MFDCPYALAISEYVFVEGDQEGGGTFTALLNLEEGTDFGESLNKVSMDGLEGAFRGVAFLTLMGEDSHGGVRLQGRGRLRRLVHEGSPQ